MPSSQRFLRDAPPSNLQKLLADGLAYAPSLQYADLQRCNLHEAYLGVRPDRSIDLSRADFFEANLTGASLKGAKAHGTVFFQAVLHDTVLSESDLTEADFRGAASGRAVRGSPPVRGALRRR